MPEHTTECRAGTLPFGHHFGPEGEIDFEAMKTIMVVVPVRLYREGIAQTLRRKNRIVWSECETLADARKSIQSQPSPDLVIVQIGESASKDKAMSTIREMRIDLPQTRWIVLSSYSDEQFLRAAVDAGVDDCLSEDASGEVLRVFTELVLLGHSFMRGQLAGCFAKTPDASFSDSYLPVNTALLADEASSQQSSETLLADAAENGITPIQPVTSSIWPTSSLKIPDAVLSDEGLRTNPIRSSFELPQSAKMVDSEQQTSHVLPSRPRVYTPILSEREQAILSLLVRGQANKTIARSLNIAEATVKVHVKALFRKMQVSNRTQAAIAASNYLKPVVMDTPQPKAMPFETENAVLLPVKNWDDQPYRAAGKF